MRSARDIRPHLRTTVWHQAISTTPHIVATPPLRHMSLLSRITHTQRLDTALIFLVPVYLSCFPVSSPSRSKRPASCKQTCVIPFLRACFMIQTLPDAGTGEFVQACLEPHGYLARACDSSSLKPNSSISFSVRRSSIIFYLRTGSFNG